jgi:Helix-turn-helix domain
MSTHAIVPHTRIDNSIIDELASKIGIYGLGIYVAIKRHLNTKTGDCFPSYQTIAKKLHIDRGTVIRYVKKLKAFNLLDPQLRFKEDGSPTSNQYNFRSCTCWLRIIPKAELGCFSLFVKRKNSSCVILCVVFS